MPSNPSPSAPGISLAKMTSFVALLLVIGVIGLLFFRVMSSFLLPLFLAALLVVIFGPAHEWWQRRLKGRRATAAALTCGLIVLTILLPLIWAVAVAINEGVDLVTRDWSNIGERLSNFRRTFRLEMPLSKELEGLRAVVQGLVSDSGTVDPDVEAWRKKLGRIERLSQQLEGKLPLAEEDVTTSGVSLERAEAVRSQIDELQSAVANTKSLLTLVPNATQLTDAQLEAAHEWSTRVEVRYRRLRHELLGGALHGWLVELANPDPDKLREWQNMLGTYLRSWLLSVTGQTTAFVGQLIVGLCIMVIATFYFFLDGPGMIKTIMRLSPIEDQYEEKLLSEFSRVSRAVVVATLLAAVLQGLLAGIGYYFTGVRPLLMLTMLTTLLAMVPFVGAASIWLPAALWLIFVDGHIIAGVGLMIYGAFVVSMADNVIKPFILHGQSNIHPLMGLLSVLGGVQALGPIGILVGPMLVAFLQALLNMLQQEIRRDSLPAASGHP